MWGVVRLHVLRVHAVALASPFKEPAIQATGQQQGGDMDMKLPAI